MRELAELINDTRIDGIKSDYQAKLREKEKLKYNLFTLSSYSYHLENFHSDIFASLLDPDGLHGEKRLFLDQFLEYLDLEQQLNINVNNFKNPVVHREKGRLDISIVDEESDKVIIIENKINDAPDQDDQLSGYCAYCEENELFIVAILYVSLRGLKKAPPLPIWQPLLRNVAVFSNEPTDMVNGWLQTCLERCQTEDGKSLLYQYIKLLKFLGFKSMEKSVLDEFYSIANEDGFLQKVKSIVNLTNKIPAYRADKFVNAVSNYAPFTKTCRHEPNHHLFDFYTENDNSFKIDIVFYENGNASILFWNPPKRYITGDKSVEDKLNQIGYLSQMKFHTNNNGFEKFFTLDEYGSMAKADDAILEFTKEFLKVLKKSAESNRG